MKHQNIPLTPVESSQIFAIGHDPGTNTLAVQFRSKSGPGNVYTYADVDAELHAEFMKAKSKGAFFGTTLKGNPKHPHTKIEKPAKEHA